MISRHDSPTATTTTTTPIAPSTSRNNHHAINQSQSKHVLPNIMPVFVRGRAKLNMVQDRLNFRALDTQHFGNFCHSYRLVKWVVSASMGEFWVACKKSQNLPSSQTSSFLIPAYTTVSTTTCSLQAVHSCYHLKHKSSVSERVSE
jgi:hypothetical protein